MFIRNAILTLLALTCFSDDREVVDVEPATDAGICPLGPQLEKALNVFTNLVASPEYMSECTAGLMPENDYEALVSGITAGSLKGHVKDGDYIISQGLIDLENIITDIHHGGPSLRQDVSLFTFLLTKDTYRQSRCESSECLAWRTVVEQLHYRVVSGETWSTEEDGAVIRKLFDASKRASDAAAEARGSRSVRRSLFASAMSPEAIAIISTVGSSALTAGCWFLGQCLRQYRLRLEAQDAANAETTTTPTEEPTIENPLSWIQNDLRKVVFQKCNAILDEILLLLGSTDTIPDADWLTKFTEIKGTILDRLKDIGPDILSVSQSSRAIVVVEMSSEVSREIGVFSGVRTDWSSAKNRVQTAVNALREEILVIALSQ